MGGAFIRSNVAFPLDKELLVEIKFGETRILEGKVIDHDSDLNKLIPESSPQESIVRWERRTADTGFGVEFVQLREDKKTFLTQLLHYFEQLEKAGCSFG